MTDNWNDCSSEQKLQCVKGSISLYYYDNRFPKSGEEKNNAEIFLTNAYYTYLPWATKEIEILNKKIDILDKTLAAVAYLHPSLVNFDKIKEEFDNLDGEND